MKGREPAKGRTATATGARRPLPAVPPPPRACGGQNSYLDVIFPALSGLIGGRKNHYGGQKKRAEGAKKIISGGEKNKVVGRPHAGGHKITSGRIGVEKITMGAEKIRSPLCSYNQYDGESPSLSLSLSRLVSAETQAS